ncbi:MAG: signal recognition particle-docking protein FtsY, partial [Erysipelotrichaceae bacterium]|nr:signal recognition particle-docking protein FtsY [Erysipelotrichaceae bacterium]
PDTEPVFAEEGPTVILLEGVNGSGKTTTAAKLAYMYKKKGKTVAFVAADTFRAGAIGQLAEWGERLDVPCIKGIENGDPSAAIVDGCRYAKENNIDILLCDTAGRLQNKAGLMAELSKMNRVCGKEIEGAPHNTWLVLDATTGQNGLSQAKIFNEATNLTGIILTKMDGTAKGGIIIAIKHELHLPVRYIGLGEKPTDLRPFDLDSYLYSISQGIENVR